MDFLPITKAVAIKNESVKQYSGLRNYLATGDLLLNEVLKVEPVTYSDKPSRANLEIHEGDILVARMKDTIKVTLVNTNMEDWIVSTGFLVLRADVSKWNNRFLYYYFSSKFFQRQKNNLSSGATQKAINNSNFRKIQIPNISISEQKRIVDLLDKADALRQKRKQAIALLDNYIESVFIDMFGDPVSNPKGWERVNINDILLRIVAGTSYSGDMKDCLDDDEMGVLKISAVTKGRFNPSQFKAVKKSNLNKVITVRTGDLLFSRANTRELVGATSIVDKDYPKLFLPDKLWRLDLNSNCEKGYLYFVLQHEGIKNLLTKTATGTSGSMLNISMQKLKSLVIPLPPISLQKSFSKKLNSVIELDKSMQKQAIKLDLQFNEMQQRIFNIAT